MIYVLTLQKGYEKTFFLMAFAGALVGALTIYSALTKEHSLWSSEFWRFAGIVVNFLAVVGFIFTVKQFFQKK